MKHIYILFIFLLFSYQSIAQNIKQRYLLEVDQLEYTPLEDAIRISDNDDWTWDYIDYEIMLDEPFRFLDIDISSFYIVDFSILDSDTYLELLLLDLSRSLQLDSSTYIQYKMEGEVGNRIFKVEWFNNGIVADTENNAYFNGQMWLHETSNIIDLFYGTGDVSDISFFFGGPVVGILTYEDDPDSEEFARHTNCISKVGDEEELIYTYVDFGDDVDVLPTLDVLPASGTRYRLIPDSGSAVKEITHIENLVYPNPVKDQLNLRNITNDQYDQIDIIDSNGKIMRSQQFSTSIDVKDLSSGTYSILLKGSEDTAVSRFIKL